MAEEKEVPKHIKLYDQLSKKADYIVESTRVSLSEAYNKAAREHLAEKGKHGLNTDLLDKEDIQQKFADSMTKHLVGEANKYFGTKFKTDKLSDEDRAQMDQLLSAYAGISRTELERNIRSRGKEYTHRAHNNLQEQYLRRIEQTLTQSAAAHLRQEHVPDFIKHMKLDNIIEAAQVRVEEIPTIYDTWREQDYQAVSPTMIKRQYVANNIAPPTFFKKKDAKKKAA